MSWEGVIAFWRHPHPPLCRPHFQLNGSPTISHIAHTGGLPPNAATFSFPSRRSRRSSAANTSTPWLTPTTRGHSSSPPPPTPSGTRSALPASCTRSLRTTGSSMPKHPSAQPIMPCTTSAGTPTASPSAITGSSRSTTARCPSSGAMRVGGMPGTS